MKLLIQNNKIIATATDDYTSDELFIIQPDSFDINRMADYEVTDGVLILSIPQVVTMRQARLALLSMALLDDIPLAIAQLPSPRKEQAEIEWEYSQTVERTKPFVISIGAALNFDLDELFTLAATL